MSGEKIDIAKIEDRAQFDINFYGPSDFASEVLALVRAVRAEIAYRRVCRGGPGLYYDTFNELEAALAPFTDSAEVRSDGE